MRIGNQNIQIDTDVPAPVARGSRNIKSDYERALRAMKVGKSSIYFDEIGEANKYRNRFYKLGALCTVRSEGRGYRLWISKKERKNGTTSALKQEGTVRKRIREIDDSHVLYFLNEATEESLNTKTSTTSLYRAFKNYCDSNHQPYLIVPEFKLAMKKLGYQESFNKHHSIFFFIGIALMISGKVISYNAITY